MSRVAPKWLKPTVDFGPLGVFLAAYYAAGILPATIALMATTLVVLALSWFHERKVALMPVVTALVVLVFGGLTVWLNDETFIKLKPTIIYTLFAVIIGIGLALKKPVLKYVLGTAIPLDDDGWRKLSGRFALFFLAMAMANEVIRAQFSTDLWVLWKVPGSLIITLVFMLTQGRLIVKHKLPE